MEIFFLKPDGPRHRGAPIAVFMWLLSVTAAAQYGSGLRLSLEDLYSTHGDHFPGISASCNRYFGKKWELGAGVGYAGAGYHEDNGWNLYQLDFIPLYLSGSFYAGASRRWRPYLHLQDGVSFVQYDKEFQDRPGMRHRIHECGFFGYGGAGIDVTISGRSGLFLESGVQAFHLSFNNLDVNPHGFAFKLGYVYQLK